MQFYHGSPKDIHILKPYKGVGWNGFESMAAVFLTKTFLHAALYALGKNLKGKTSFGVAENKLVIVGNRPPGQGYVYEVEADIPIKGPNGQYAAQSELRPSNKWKVIPSNFKKYIFYVNNKKEMDKLLRIKISKISN
jgi:hypothetical protein